MWLKVSEKRLKGGDSLFDIIRSVFLFINSVNVKDILLYKTSTSQYFVNIHM